MLNEDGIVKICDFGLSKLMVGTIHTKTFAGTMCYSSPELLKCLFSDSEEYSFNTDIWLVNLIFWNRIVFFLEFSLRNLSVFLNQLILSEKKNVSDYWYMFLIFEIRSLGCVLYEMLTLEKAFPRGPGETARHLNFDVHLVYGPLLQK